MDEFRDWHKKKVTGPEISQKIHNFNSIIVNLGENGGIMTIR